jgi:addiction module RelB/DinJ family antitoxin
VVYTGVIMNTTVINIKTDKILKKDAQRLAKNFGLPLSAIINTYLREFVREKRIVFSEPPTPNAKTKKILDRAIADIKAGKNLVGPFESAGEMDEFLNSLKNR